MAKYLNKDLHSYQKEVKSFLANLAEFHERRRTPYKRIPWIGGREVDLCLLYTKVTEMGGWLKVNEAEKWDEIQEYFNLPKGTVNAGEALKQIYIRYLDAYEKVYFLGEDPDKQEEEDEGHRHAKKRTNTPITKVAMRYNYSQHDLPEYIRENHGMSDKFAPLAPYGALEKSLLSGLPNEVDFAINVCTLLSNEGKHALRVEEAPKLIDLLMAHIGIFHEGPGALTSLYDHAWRPVTKRNFVRFWYDSVEDTDLHDLIGCEDMVKHCDTRQLCGSDVLNLGTELGIRNMEGQRVLQLANIFRNLSFEEDNVQPLAGNILIFRFLMLLAHCKFSELKQLGLDTLGNLSLQLVLDPIDVRNTQLLMETLCKCIASPDKFEVVRGMEILSKLCQVDPNEDIITGSLESKTYNDIVSYLTVQDIQLIVYTLEVLYQLSELGEVTSTAIAAAHMCVEMLIGLVTIEAQSYGPNSLIGIKVVEHGSVLGLPAPNQQPVGSSQPVGSANLKTGAVPTPPPQQNPVTVQQQQFPRPQPVQQAPQQQQQYTIQQKPVQQIMNQQQPPALQQQQQQNQPMIDKGAFACNWLNAYWESRTDSSVSKVDLYSEYLAACSKFLGRDHMLSSQAFHAIVKNVFKNTDFITVKKGGTMEVHFKNICKRVKPLPFHPVVMKPVGVQKPIQYPGAQVGVPRQTSTPPHPVPIKPMPPQRKLPLLLPKPPAVGPLLQQHLLAPNNPPGTAASNTMPGPGLATVNASGSGVLTSHGGAALQSQVNSTLVSTSTQGAQQTITLIRPNMPGSPVLNIQQTAIKHDSNLIKNLLAKKVRMRGATSPSPSQNSSEPTPPSTPTLQYPATPPHTPTSTTMPASPVAPKQFDPNGPQCTPVRRSLPVMQSTPVKHPATAPQQPLGSPIRGSPARSRSPKGSPRPVTTTTTTVGGFNLEVCTGAQRAHDIVQDDEVAKEAVIEKVENTSINRLKNKPLVINTNIITTTKDIVGCDENHTGATIPTEQAIQQTQPPEQSNQNVNAIVNVPEQCQNAPVQIDTLCSNSGEKIVEQCVNQPDQGKVNEQCTKNPPITVVTENSKTLPVNGLNSESQSESPMDNNLKATESLFSEPKSSSALSQGTDISQSGISQPSSGISQASSHTTDSKSEKLDSSEQKSDSGKLNHQDLTTSGETLDSNGQSSPKSQKMAVESSKSDSVGPCNSVGKCDNNGTKKLNGIPEKHPPVNGDVTSMNVSEKLINGPLDPSHILPKDKTQLVGEKLEKINQLFEETKSLNGVVHHMNNGTLSEKEITKLKKEEMVKLMKKGEEMNGDLAIGLCKDINVAKKVLENGYSSSGADSELDVPIHNTKKCAHNNSNPKSKNGPKHSIQVYTASVTKDNGETDKDKEKAMLNDSMRSNSEEETDNAVAALLGCVTDSDDEVNAELNQSGEIPPEQLTSEQIILTPILADSPQTSEQIETTSLPLTNGTVMVIKDEPETKEEPMDTEPSGAVILPAKVQKSQSTSSDNLDAVINAVAEGNFVPKKEPVPVTPQKISFFTTNYQNQTNQPQFSPAGSSRSSVMSPPPQSPGGDIFAKIDQHIQGSLIAAALRRPSFEEDNRSRSPTKRSFTDSPMPEERQDPPLPKPKKRKSRGKASIDSRRSSTQSEASTVISNMGTGQYMCEWALCQRFFETPAGVLNHISKLHLSAIVNDGTCMWEGCDGLRRKKWSLYTHIQDRHCTEHALKAAALRRQQLQNVPGGGGLIPQGVNAGPTPPAPVYPHDAAIQAIRRFSIKPPYPELMEPKEGPVTKHIRLTSSLILRNLARYSAVGRTCIKRHEGQLAYVALSPVESSTAISNCLWELHQHH